MDIKKKHLIVICSAMAAAFSIALVANSQSNLIIGDASDVHNGNCNWNHYEKVDATYDHHGSKEFYACCSHPGNISFDRPSEGNIVDMGVFSGDYFDSLSSDDARYIPSLYEGMELLYDNQYNYLVPGQGSYTPPSWTPSAGKLDSTYGYYCNLEINQTPAAEEWVWFKPAVQTNISSYKQIVFYMKSNQDVTIQLNGYDSAAINSGKYALVAGEWTKIVYNVSDGATALDQIAPSFWIDAVRTDLVWDITSIYGVPTSSTTDSFDGMDLLYDCKEQVFVPQNYTPTSHEEKCGLLDSKYGYYSTINIKQLSGKNQDAAWFRVADSFAGISLTDYKEIVFYIKSNQKITNFNVRADSYDVVVSDTTLNENVWTKIVVPVSDKTKTLKDIAPASWGEKTDLLWSITSLYGAK